MAWLWNSWEEYVENVQPVAKRRGAFRSARNSTYFEAQSRIFENWKDFQEAVNQLRALGFTGRDNESPPNDESILDEARRAVSELVNAGETLLLFHKRLALSDDAYGFLSQHDILEHWERYLGSGRVFQEIFQLVEDADEMITGFNRIINEDEKFLTYGLRLPDELEADFRTARNLFSIGAEDIGLFTAGRGLESVLRNVAKTRKIMLARKNQIEPAHEASLSDLIEVMARLRWKRTGELLITQQTKALLHFLRTERNGQAHASPGRKKTLGPRELASIVTHAADQLWKETAGTRATFAQTTIQKTW